MPLMPAGLTDGPSSTYSAAEMAHEWYHAGRPAEMRSAQETRTNYDLTADIDFDYLTAHLVRVQSAGDGTDWITYFAVFRSPGDKLQVEWYPARSARFFDHRGQDAYEVIRWFVDWAEDRMQELDAESSRMVK